MKYLSLIVWMLFSMVLVFSIIGLLLFIPKINYTNYYKPQEELRSTWMRIGYGLLQNIK